MHGQLGPLGAQWACSHTVTHLVTLGVLGVHTTIPLSASHPYGAYYSNIINSIDSTHTKRGAIIGTYHRIDRNTSTLTLYDQAKKEKKMELLSLGYPINFIRLVFFSDFRKNSLGVYNTQRADCLTPSYDELDVMKFAIVVPHGFLERLRTLA